MMMVMIHEGVIKGEKIKIGGKLATMVKANKDELKALLCNSGKIDGEMNKD